jgi:hypothetical protein
VIGCACSDPGLVAMRAQHIITQMIVTPLPPGSEDSDAWLNGL